MGDTIANLLYCNVISVKRADQVFRPTQYVFLLTKLLVELVALKSLPRVILRMSSAGLHVVQFTCSFLRFP